MKELASGDFMKAWGGISSIQFALPVLWTIARKHHCSLSDVAKWLEKPAVLTGKQTAKERSLKIRCRFVVWDPDQQFTIMESLIHHKHKITLPG
jgi:allantoinase